MGKQPVLVVNKMDDPEDDYAFEDFQRLGFSAQIGLSAEHGHGVDQLTALFQQLLPPPTIPSAEADSLRTRIAFIGRPNVGKVISL